MPDSTIKDDVSRAAPAPSPLPEINVSGARLRELTDEAMEALSAVRNQGEPKFYQRGSALARLMLPTGDDGLHSPDIQALDAIALRGEMERAADWMENTRFGPRPTDAPMKVASDIMSLRQYSGRLFPILDVIAETPFYDGDFRLVLSPGYHSASRVFMRLDSALKIPAVSGTPSAEDVKVARNLLLEMFVDFPFVGDADRAHILSAIFYPYLRKPIDMPPPGLLVDADSPGSGKGLLVSAATMLNMGAELEITPATDRDDNETRKRLTALFLSGASYCVIDNVHRIIRDPSFAAALTAPIWKDRVLGVSRMVSLPNRTLFFVTGNNVRCTDEMTRRFIRTRLEANVEHPERRTEFRHDPLLDWIRHERGRLIWAVLTLVQNWVAQGRMEFTARRLGSFEKWSRIIGGILEASGITGFLEDRDTMSAEVDEDTTGWTLFVRAWFEKHAGKPVRVMDLVPLIEDTIDSEFSTVPDQDRALETRLGILLKVRRGRVFAGHKIVPAELIGSKRQKRPGWRLEDPAPQKPDKSDSDSTAAPSSDPAAASGPAAAPSSGPSSDADRRDTGCDEPPAAPEEIARGGNPPKRSVQVCAKSEIQKNPLNIREIPAQTLHRPAHAAQTSWQDFSKGLCTEKPLQNKNFSVQTASAQTCTDLFEGFSGNGADPTPSKSPQTAPAAPESKWKSGYGKEFWEELSQHPVEYILDNLPPFGAAPDGPPVDLSTGKAKRKTDKIKKLKTTKRVTSGSDGGDDHNG